MAYSTLSTLTISEKDCNIDEGGALTRNLSFSKCHQRLIRNSNDLHRSAHVTLTSAELLVLQNLHQGRQNERARERARER